MVVCCFDRLHVQVHKSGPAIGVTISDNGAGKAFVKKVRAGSLAEENDVKPGMVFAKINGTDVNNMRHHEVAAILKEIPVGSTFTLKVCVPRAIDDGFVDNHAAAANKGDSEMPEQVIAKDPADKVVTLYKRTDKTFGYEKLRTFAVRTL